MEATRHNAIAREKIIKFLLKEETNMMDVRETMRCMNKEALELFAMDLIQLLKQKNET